MADEDITASEEKQEEAPASSSSPPPGKTFTQEQLNAFLADERRKAQKANERVIRQLEDLKKTASFTSEEKEKLEARIEDLRNEYLTKEELAKKEAKKESDKAKKEKEDLIRDRDSWKDKYTNYSIERDLYDASAGEAYNPIQIVNLLRPSTRLVEEYDAEGQATGRLLPKVRLAGKDKDGKAVTLDLSPAEAIQQMKDSSEHANLFKSGAHSGAGSTNNSAAKSNAGPPTDDPAAYRQWRKTVGLKR